MKNYSLDLEWNSSFLTVSESCLLQEKKKNEALLEVISY